MQHEILTWRYRYYGDRANMRLNNGTAELGSRDRGAY
jgi:hypothetical protein